MKQAIKTRDRKFSGTVGPTDDKKYGHVASKYSKIFNRYSLMIQF